LIVSAATSVAAGRSLGRFGRFVGNEPQPPPPAPAPRRWRLARPGAVTGRRLAILSGGAPVGRRLFTRSALGVRDVRAGGTVAHRRAQIAPSRLPVALSRRVVAILLHRAAFYAR
jgi:hypothetical protein